jgi:hypothetical protein
MKCACGAEADPDWGECYECFGRESERDGGLRSGLAEGMYRHMGRHEIADSIAQDRADRLALITIEKRGDWWHWEAPCVSCGFPMQGESRGTKRDARNAARCVYCPSCRAQATP